MTLKTVTVIDYGVGNLLSVRRGLEYNDALVKVTGDPEEIFQSGRPQRFMDLQAHAEGALGR